MNLLRGQHSFRKLREWWQASGGVRWVGSAFAEEQKSFSLNKYNDNLGDTGRLSTSLSVSLSLRPPSFLNERKMRKSGVLVYAQREKENVTRTRTLHWPRVENSFIFSHFGRTNRLSVFFSSFYVYLQNVTIQH